MNIVLLEPEIPANTGNIGRTCVATGTALHLIDPLGFSLDEKSIKRAGMDYWKELDVTRHADWEEFVAWAKTKAESAGVPASAKAAEPRFVFASTKGTHVYSDFKFRENDYIVFGKESAGIPEEILVKNPETTIRIPMVGETRSLNLSNSVAIVLYEALRQQGFEGMKLEGALHRLHW